MGCLFLISGYFTPGSYDRKGPKRFPKDRLLHLGIPLLVFLALAMRDVQMFHLLKFAFAVVIAVPLSFALGNVIRKLPLTRRIL